MTVASWLVPLCEWLQAGWDSRERAGAAGSAIHVWKRVERWEAAAEGDAESNERAGHSRPSDGWVAARILRPTCASS